ncbi:MAG: hypothetical protein ACLUKN_09050 [Bacilli bacterium]
MMIERASDAGKIADKVLTNYDKKHSSSTYVSESLESKYNRIGHCLFEKFRRQCSPPLSKTQKRMEAA